MQRSAPPAALLFVGALALAGCSPKYPACKSDEDCNREEQRHEFCVNELCQKCRNDKDCEEGFRCNKGRCDAIPNWCKDDKGCPSGYCENHECKPCVDDGQCGEGGKCLKGKCFRAGEPLPCKTDDDCPEGQDCINNRCLSVAPKKASQSAACRLNAVYFDFNESVLTNEATQAIDGNGDCIRKVGRPVQIIGRTDPRGTEEYNLALSERRAQSVRDRLMRLGIDIEKVRVLPRGELDATGRDEAGWAQDRRVDFEWM
jgi:peptidoglycan-associated lipoprotein